MRVAIGTDHAGFPLKQTVIDAVKKLGHEVIDLGTNSTDRVDYPDYALKVTDKVLTGEADRGIAICGSGVGVCITCNKIPGIYAALCHDVYTAHQGVEHDGMNVLCLGGRVIGVEVASEIVASFLRAKQSSESRYLKRLDKIKAIEKRYAGAKHE
jgi:RpiB/LacA/LacB family sugar-phosphate isomerase